MWWSCGSCDSHVTVVINLCVCVVLHMTVIWRSCDSHIKSCDLCLCQDNQLHRPDERLVRQEDIPRGGQLETVGTTPGMYPSPFFFPSLLPPSSFLPPLSLFSSSLPLSLSTFPPSLPLGSSWYLWSECPRSSLLLHDCKRAADISQVPPAKVDEVANFHENTGALSWLTGRPTAAHSYVMWLACDCLQ